MLSRSGADPADPADHPLIPCASMLYGAVATPDNMDPAGYHIPPPSAYPSAAHFPQFFSIFCQRSASVPIPSAGTYKCHILWCSLINPRDISHYHTIYCGGPFHGRSYLPQPYQSVPLFHSPRTLSPTFSGSYPVPIVPVSPPGTIWYSARTPEWYHIP